MKNSIKIFALIVISAFGFDTSAFAQTVLATNSADQLQECLLQRHNYPTEAQACIGACRGVRTENATDVKKNQCQNAYNNFRKAAGRPYEELPDKLSYELDFLTAIFSLRNGRLDRFKLVGDNSELAKHAAKVCIFQLPESQLQGYRGPFHSQFNDKIREFKQQGKPFAYQLSEISWSEDGLSTLYPCQVKRVDVVPID